MSQAQERKRDLPRAAGEGVRGSAGEELETRASTEQGLSAPSLAKRGRVGVTASSIIDITTTSIRLGLKGPRAADWLQSQGILLPDAANTWRPLSEDTSLIARLGSTEFFLEQAAPTALLQQLATQLRSPLDGVYPVLREDRAFVLDGPEANDVLAQVCNVDFESVSRSARHVVMTMMIGIAVLVIPQEKYRGHSSISLGRDSIGNGESKNVPNSSASNGARSANGGCYRIWCDPTYGDYLWSSLQGVISGT